MKTYNEILKDIEKTKKALAAMEAERDTFNVYAVDGIKRIYKDQYIYEKFTV